MAAAELLQRQSQAGLSDEDVVRAVCAGDVASYEILMRRHNQTLYRAVRAILRDESAVEDVLQEAYLAAYRNLAEFEGRARFSTWLVQIAVNKALDLRRRRLRGSDVALDEERSPGDPRDFGSAPSAGDDPERASARREIALALEQAIDGLPESFREVYVLRDVEGWSTEETAEGLGLALATVRTRLHRARQSLRERLACDFDAAALNAFPFGAARCDSLVAAVLAVLSRTERGGCAA